MTLAATARPMVAPAAASSSPSSEPEAAGLMVVVVAVLDSTEGCTSATTVASVADPWGSALRKASIKVVLGKMLMASVAAWFPEFKSPSKANWNLRRCGWAG